MAGYSYFNYNQMTLLEVEVHSEELGLLKQASDEYDWDAIKEAALDFRNRKRSSVCPRKNESETSLQKTFPFLDETKATKV